MSREAVFRALYSDTELNALGITRSEVFPNYSMEQTPTKDKRFLVLRWEEFQISPVVSRGPQILTVWAHCPTKLSNDYDPLDRILARVKAVLTNLEHAEGTDSNTVTSIRWTGTGGDLRDPGFDTITKNSAFRVLFRPTDDV